VADIFHDIEDGLRQDRLKKLWRRSRWPILGLVLAIVAAVVAFVLVRDATETRQLEQASKFFSAIETLERGDKITAGDMFTSLADSAEDKGYATFSRLRSAQSYVANGDIQSAVAIYDGIAGNGSIDPLYRDLSVYLAADLLIDSASFKEVNQRLSSIMIDSNVWKPMAQETLGIAAYKAGQTDKAKEIFLSLSKEQTVPPGVKDRAIKLLATLSKDNMSSQVTQD